MTTRAFTILEILIVVAMTTLLLGLMLPGLRKARSKADIAACTGNARQIAIAWVAYSGDSNERIVINVDGFFGGRTNWVAGNMADITDATNTLLLIDSGRSLLASYATNPKVYKCPTDESWNVRSVSMNCRLNPYRSDGAPPRWISDGTEHFRSFQSMHDVRRPSDTFLAIDENPEKVNDAYFAVDMTNTGSPDGKGVKGKPYIIDIPTSSHEQGAIISFVDGHVERHRWSNPSRIKDAVPRTQVFELEKDVRWLQKVSTHE